MSIWNDDSPEWLFLMQVECDCGEQATRRVMGLPICEQCAEEWKVELALWDDRPEPESVVCQRCDGDGEHEFSGDTCWMCNGTGWTA